MASAQLAHRTAEPPAFVSQTEIRFFFRQAMACLQNAFRSFDQLTRLKLPAHFGRFFDQPGIFFRKKALHNRSAHLLAYKSQERDFIGRVRMSIAVMDVDHANHLAPAQAAERKETPHKYLRREPGSV